MWNYKELKQNNYEIIQYAEQQWVILMEHILNNLIKFYYK